MESGQSAAEAELSNKSMHQKMQELERQKAEIEKKYLQERERNRALRFKAGQIFLHSLENTEGIALKGKRKGENSEYYLHDDGALMRLL